MSRRISFSYEDAALLLRAAEGWYVGLEEANRGTEWHADTVEDLKRVRALKKRARLNKTALEHILATAETVTVNISGIAK